MFALADWYARLVEGPALPLLIFLAETCVVCFGTLRIILMARGGRFLAPMLGFFEISIWLFAIGQIMQNLDQLACYVAFAGGFVFGNFLGIWIEDKLAIGMSVVRIITSQNGQSLLESLRAAGYGVTVLEGEGARGEVRILFTVIKRRDVGNVVALIQQCHPSAFYSVEDLRTARAGVFPLVPARSPRVMQQALRMVRVGK